MTSASIPLDIAGLAGLREKDLRSAGLVLAEGRLLVERLLASAGADRTAEKPAAALLGPRFEPICLFCVPALAGHFGPLCDGLCEMRELPEAACAEIAGYPFHRGALLLAKRPAAIFLEDYGAAGIAALQSLVLLPATADPENIGSIMRSAAALGYGGIAIGPDCCDPYSRKALRTSMGAAFSLPLFLMRGPEALGTIQAAGFCTLAAVLGQGARPLRDWEQGSTLAPYAGQCAEQTDRGTEAAGGRVALLFGNEYKGLAPEWLPPGVTRLTIPMAPGSDSLNAAVAAAVFMYEISQKLEAADSTCTS